MGSNERNDVGARELSTKTHERITWPFCNGGQVSTQFVIYTIVKGFGNAKFRKLSSVSKKSRRSKG
jgi:hypothetical protein